MAETPEVKSEEPAAKEKELKAKELESKVDAIIEHAKRKESTYKERDYDIMNLMMIMREKSSTPELIEKILSLNIDGVTFSIGSYTGQTNTFLMMIDLEKVKALRSSKVKEIKDAAAMVYEVRYFYEGHLRSDLESREDKRNEQRKKKEEEEKKKEADTMIEEMEE